ncbi:nitroreductase family protein [Gallibacterium genomosp. 2]|uniref:nitroreductase family protein n=1 Tax=Gallibacterium genomosp. 2 TaxID=155517 RepID=UPI000AE5D9CF|nr:nitroreductase family protein [Gallibacterium genomosp. 2]
MSVESFLLNRHANRCLDPNVKISQEELVELLALAGKAPSAFNTQPWRVVVLTEQPAKERLFPIAFNQKQVLDASAVLMILA